MSSTDVEKRTPQQELVAQVALSQFQSQVRLALPGGVTPARFVRIAVTALQQNPDLAECEPGSVFNALLRAAQDGLLPDGREAALVVFKVKGVQKAVYLPMIAGFRKIAAESGWTLRSAVVYSKDEFEFELGLEQRLLHRPAPFTEHRGEPIGAYAVGVGPGGQREFVVLSKAEIEKVRAVSRSAELGPWVDWTDEMWEKTAGRKLFKRLPLGERDQERVARVLEASGARCGRVA